MKNRSGNTRVTKVFCILSIIVSILGMLCWYGYYNNWLIQHIKPDILANIICASLTLIPLIICIIILITAKKAKKNSLRIVISIVALILSLAGIGYTFGKMTTIRALPDMSSAFHCDECKNGKKTCYYYKDEAIESNYNLEKDNAYYTHDWPCE